MRVKKKFFLFPLAGIATFYSLNCFFPIATWVITILSMCCYPFLIMQNSFLHYYHERTIKKNLIYEYAALKRDYENILEEYIRTKANHHFAAQTEELRNFDMRFSGKKALAHVIFKHFDNTSHYFLINQGSYHGIQEGMVAVYKNTIIGRIISVFPFYSKVLLVSDQACKISVYCDTTKTAAIYHGNNTLQTASLSHVSHLNTIEVGEMVFSSGEGLIYPRGFAIGKIISVEKNGIHQQVRVSLLVDLASITYIYLLHKSDY